MGRVGGNLSVIVPGAGTDVINTIWELIVEKWNSLVGLGWPYVSLVRYRCHCIPTVIGWWGNLHDVKASRKKTNCVIIDLCTRGLLGLVVYQQSPTKTNINSQSWAQALPPLVDLLKDK